MSKYMVGVNCACDRPGQHALQHGAALDSLVGQDVDHAGGAAPSPEQVEPADRHERRLSHPNRTRVQLDDALHSEAVSEPFTKQYSQNSTIN